MSDRPPAPLARASERRVARRTAMSVEMSLSSDSHFFVGLSDDISTGGVFLATYERLAPGDELTMDFQLPSGEEVHARGCVRWTRKAGDGVPPGVGVAFEELDAGTRAAIERFCESRPPLYYDVDTEE